MRAAARLARAAPGAALAGVPVALAELTVEIAGLDAEGRGVARSPEGKVLFVEGALPGERAAVQIMTGGRRFDLARATRLLSESPGRRAPRCPHFGVCGGCVTQHADLATQVAAKQDWLLQNLARIGKVEPERVLPMVTGEEWGYRHRARLSARRVERKGGVMVGFRERRSTYVTDMHQCPVLPPRMSALIDPLRELIEQLSIPSRLPQVEIAVGDNAAALVLRHLLPLSAEDHAHLRTFAREHAVHLWLQPGGPESAAPFEPAQSDLYYDLPEFAVRIHFRPTDFTQVNHTVNRLLVARALELLDPRPGERIADLFCGLGNFSLPLARRGAQVIGFEGASGLVARARANAACNGLVAQFEQMDLFAPSLAAFGRFDKLLIDPPRQGAIEIVKALDAPLPGRIAYVSCDPATLARDAGVLVHTKDYRLSAAGIVNMFPHTAHVESIALFERQ
ncbi:MAG TPA: 23S rRNA (uracil(1939)-C(5))-methyltransferase RlmD [Burkholderiales bacterium]|nr:23S rRNA (uracil(1939)-C(5))-methyltransferase RlmD [Burkholderiales bacterium]